jgi:hypothetical protein
MPKLLLVCGRYWSEINSDSLQLYSIINFLVTHLNLELIIQDLDDSLEGLVTDEIVGILLRYERYSCSQEVDRITKEAKRCMGSEKPFAIIPSLCETPPPAEASIYNPECHPLPVWLQPYLDREKMIEIGNPYLALDRETFKRYPEGVYQAAITKAKSLSHNEIETALRESRHDGVGLGPWINTFLIDANHLLVMVNGRHDSHEALHHGMKILLLYHRSTFGANEMKLENIQLVNGWIYRLTGPIEIPVLEFGASRNDWDSAEVGPALRRVVAWIHAQRQVIPMLPDPDYTIIDPTMI